MPLLECRILKIQFSAFSLTCIGILSWHFAYDFVLLYYRSSSSVVNFLRFFVGVMPLLELRILEMHSFPHFSLTCFDILRWNIAYDFVLLYYRSSSSVVNFRQFLMKLNPFLNLEYWKSTVFRTFLLHALTYWAEILHISLFYCTTDYVWVSLISVNFCRSYAPFYTPVFRRDVLWYGDVRPSVRLSVRPSDSPSGSPSTRFPHFSPTCFDILSWNFAHDFAVMYCRSSWVRGSSFCVNFWRSYAYLWT